MNITKDDMADVYATARMAHMGQKRRSGEEYFTHPTAVKDIVKKYYSDDKLSQLVALLHDTLEDAPGLTMDSVEEMEVFIRGSIRDPRVAEKVLSSVRALTHDKSIDYSSYVASLLRNPTALRVKLADMLHNLGTNPTQKQKNKYMTALADLSDAAGGIPKSIHAGHWQEILKIVEPRELQELRQLISEVILHVDLY